MPDIDPELWVLVHGMATNEWPWQQQWAAFLAYLKVLRGNLEDPGSKDDRSAVFQRKWELLRTWFDRMKHGLDGVLEGQPMLPELGSDVTPTMLDNLIQDFTDFDEARIYCALCGHPVGGSSLAKGGYYHTKDGERDAEQDYDHRPEVTVLNLWKAGTGRADLVQTVVEVANLWSTWISDPDRGEIQDLGLVLDIEPNGHVEVTLGLAYDAYLDALYDYVGRSLQEAPDA